MKIDNNLIIICLTCIICIHIIMNKILEIAMTKTSGKLMNENFDEISKLIEEDKKRKELK